MMSPYDAVTRLASAAADVCAGPRAIARPRDLPAMLALTDPQRQPDPVELAGQLPPGTGLIYRHFGDPDRLAIARATVDRARKRGVIVLVSADPGLARLSGADGVHWPERDIPVAAQMRARGCNLLFTASAHSPAALTQAHKAGVDAVLVSTVFASASPSAGRPMGPMALAALARRTDLPVYALGGINTRTIKRLAGLNISGVAVVGAIRSAGPTQT